MAKLKDFLQKTFEQGDVRGDDVAALLGASALAELEIPDTAVQKFSESYLTRSRAENDPEIVKKIKFASKSETLDAVDKEIAKFFPMIDATKIHELEKEKNTFKRIELLTDALGDAMKNSKVSKDKDVQKTEEEWANKLKLVQKQHKEEVELLNKTFVDEKVNFALKSKLLNFDYADAFSGIKDALTETLIGKIKSTQVKDKPIVLELDGSGNLNVLHEVEGTLKFVYRDGNEKLTIDNLITPHVEPFLKKSTGTGNGTPPTPKPPIKDASKMTLAELRIAGAVA